MPASADQTENDGVLYMLLDERGELVEAIGTIECFWEPTNLADVMYRMGPDLELAQSTGAVMVIPKIPMHSQTRP